MRPADPALAGADAASPPRLTEDEMRTWEELIEALAPDGTGRAHEMLLAAFAEIRLHRAAQARLEA